MGRISIELVPRSLASLEGDLRALRERFPAVDTARPVHPARPVDWIRRLEQEAPGLRVYGCFDPDRAGRRAELEWNRRLAEAALRWLRAHDADAYFMPIRTGPDAWLGGLL